VSTSPALLVPPVRLGRLLADARERSGETLEQLARRCGLAREEDFFAEIEAGSAPLDETLVRWLAELYGVAATALVPARAHLVIDLREGRVEIGDRRAAVTGIDPDQILTNYLALVYSLRGLPVGTPIPLRNIDLGVLSDALSLSTREVSSNIGRIMIGQPDAVRDRAQVVRRRMIVPVAGILVGLTAMGALLLVRSDDAAAGHGPEPTAVESVSAAGVAPPVHIGEAVVIERSSSDDAGSGQRVRTG
jgi:transcriptional regulator with XRE-family HTH domain